MIKTRKELKEILNIDKQAYYTYMFPTKKRKLMASFKKEPAWLIMKWQIISRKVDYYKYKIDHDANIYEKLRYLYYIRKRNILSSKLGLEIGTENIKSGLLIYHYAGGCVVNSGSEIGSNCHMHGNNCIGNAGPHDLRCPIIGDNVMLGVGAKIIGNVKIANGIRVAAGAVVIHSFEEENITIAGVPAKKVSK